MKQSWTTYISAAGLLAALLGSPAPLRAQDPGDAPPKPAAHAYPPLDTTTTDDTPSPDTLLPDSTPLTGVQSPTLGRIESPHSYWEPGFSYSNTSQSNNPGSSNNGWSTTNYLAANVSLLESWRAAQLAVNYSGGGEVSTDKSVGDGAFQQLGVSQSFQWARWQVLLLDNFSYLPTSEFGFGGGTGLGVAGGGIGGGISTGVPTTGTGGNYQTLFDAVGPRYTDNFTGQAVYLLSPRSSMNVSGTYGILRFVNPGNIDTDNSGASVGYNYQLNKTDTIGLVYHFTHFSYVGAPQTIDDHSFSFAYGKKITGKLALQVYGGPDITEFGIPIGGQSHEVSGSGGGSLLYGFSNRGSVSLGYSHSVTGGNGVSAAGQETDQVTGNISHAVGRVWRVQANVGYARNRSIVSSAPQTSYNTVYVGGGFSRPLGPNANFAFAYSGNIQATAAAGCMGSACNSTYTEHQLVVTFQWHTRPLVLR